MKNLQIRLKFKKGKQKELLLEFMKLMKCFSQRKLGDILKVKRSTAVNWINESLTLPLPIFEKICSKRKELKKFKKFIIKQLQSNWGSKKGGNVRKKQFGDMKKFYKHLRRKK